MLDDVSTCFDNAKESNELPRRLLEASNFVSQHVITKDSPFLFFIDGTSVLTEMDALGIDSKIVAPMKILQQALSYLDPKTRLFFVNLGSATFEYCAKYRKAHAPIISTQNFDIWREEYPFEKFEPCYHGILNCNMFKLLVTKGHPLFSSIYYFNMMNIASKKLLYTESKDTYLMAIWMVRTGVTCDPRSRLAGILVQSHMGVLQRVVRVRTKLLILHPSALILAMAAGCIINFKFALNARYEFFQVLMENLFNIWIDRDGIKNAIAAKLFLFAADDVQKNEAKTYLAEGTVEKMVNLCPLQFESV